jgi:hypothetical protein
MPLPSHPVTTLYDNMDSGDLNDELLLLYSYYKYPNAQSIRTGQSGQEYLLELLHSGHPERIHHVLRMSLDTFYSLRDWLLANTRLEGDLIDSNWRKAGASNRVSIEEKLAIFIYIVSRPASSRDTAERFSRALHTIHE